MLYKCQIVIKYISTRNFIKICHEPHTKRLEAFRKSVGLEPGFLQLYLQEIEKILKFVSEIDTSYHNFDQNKITRKTFFGQIFHAFIVSDLRAMIILSITGQQNQVNIILRHLIENLIYSLWADFTSKFSIITEYFLYPEEWKPFRTQQKILWDQDERNYPQRSIRERLERIRLLNFESKGGKEFYRKYFRTATMCDILILLSLPICSSCIQKSDLATNKIQKINYRVYHISRSVRKQGKEDEHAFYRTDFGYYCSFCKRQRLTEAFALGIPDVDDMIEMLTKAVISNANVAENFKRIKNIYAYLSSNYVHFSTAGLPDVKPEPFNSSGGKVYLWGFEGIMFFIKLLDPIMKYYFKELTRTYRA